MGNLVFLRRGACIALLTVTFAAIQPATAQTLKPVRSMAVRVIDGDTFGYQGERIRILDIDTPETHPARCAYEAELGARATERLRQLLARPFALQVRGRDEDRYGRKLRLVVTGGRSVGDQLVAEGLARPYGRGRQPWCQVS